MARSLPHSTALIFVAAVAFSSGIAGWAGGSILPSEFHCPKCGRPEVKIYGRYVPEEQLPPGTLSIRFLPIAEREDVWVCEMCRCYGPISEVKPE